MYIIQNSRAHKNGIYTVHSLLNNILPSYQIEQAVSDRRYGWRLKENLEEALLILKDEVGMKIEFDDETYPMWLRPLWAMPDEVSNLSGQERNQQLLGTKRFPDKYIQNFLLPAKLIFKVSVKTQRNLSQFETQKKHTAKEISERKPKNHDVHTRVSTSELVETHSQAEAISQIVELTQTNEFTGAILRQIRTAKRISQREIARAVGMSQSWVRDIETEGSDKVVAEKYAVKLKEVLGLV